MRLAILSDIHGNLLALEAVLADLKTRSVDATVNLGDCVTNPLWPRETLELLDTLSLPTVRGNHDRWIAERTRSQIGADWATRFSAIHFAVC
jgi:predicted phosphodiesterase